ncbi:hypothetical protein ACWC09_29570 [Streptomyces sp. NPDC001617]
MRPVWPNSGAPAMKKFHAPRTLTADLAALGWSARVRPVGGNIVGVAEPPFRAVDV